MEIDFIKKLLLTIKKKYEISKKELELTDEDYEFLKKELKFLVKSDSLMKDIMYYLSNKKFGGTKNKYNSMIFYILGITIKKPDITKEFNFEYELDRKNTRLSPPDVDIDFEHREEILRYLEHKYGKNQVALIGTSITYKPKAALQFCAKAQNIANTEYAPEARRFSSQNDQEAKRISKIIPNLPAYSLEQWLGEEEIKDSKNQKVIAAMEALKEEAKKYPEVFNAAKKICGLNKSYGTHAAGVVISYRDVSTDVPLFVGKFTDTDELEELGLTEDDISISKRMSTQYDWRECEELGLLKFDFLQLNNLRQMSLVERLVKERHNKEISVESLVPNDPKVFKTIDDLKLEGLFQISGPAFTSWYVKWDRETRKNIRDSKGRIQLGKRKGLMETIGCHDFNDIVAANALGRPGALAFKLHEKYREAKENPESIKYPHPELKSILQPTYGQLCFQEQLIKMSMKLAGFNFSEADKLRKACGKKEVKILNEMESKFREGCKKNNIPSSVIDQMWEIAIEFGNYAFNAAHSTAYGYIAYQTAWLKTYYPTEFICSILTSQAQKSEEELDISIEKFLKEYEKLKILPIDVNFSKHTFFPEEDFIIRAPLDSIKGIGPKASEEIVANQPYVSVQDFMARVGSISLNSRELETLRENNAFNSLGKPDYVAREIMSYTKIAEMTAKKKKSSNIVTKNLF